MCIQWNPSITDTFGDQHFSWRQRKGRMAWLALCNVHVLWSQVHKRMLNAADGWQLWEKKVKKSVHRRNQESDRRAIEKEFKSRKYVLEILAQAKRLGSLFMLPSFCTVFWTPTKRAMPDTTAACPIRAWCFARREASYACIVPVGPF